MSDVIAGLSDAELKALDKAMRLRMKAIRSHEQSKADERRAEIGVLASDVFTHVVQTYELEESDSSSWAGYSDYAIPLEVDGRKYHVSFRVTDLQRKEERKPGTAEEVAAGKADFVLRKKSED